MASVAQARAAVGALASLAWPSCTAVRVRAEVWPGALSGVCLYSVRVEVAGAAVYAGAGFLGDVLAELVEAIEVPS